MAPPELTTNPNSTTAGREQIVRDYLEALAARDIDRCTEFFTDDAVIHFQSGVFQGTAAIKEWHRARVEASMEVVEVSKISVKGDKVTVDAVVTSSKLRAWKIKRLGGKVILTFEGDKFKSANFKARVYNPLEGW